MRKAGKKVPRKSEGLLDILSDGKKEWSSPFKKKRGICFIPLERNVNEENAP